jgi:hypothetical protein
MGRMDVGRMVVMRGPLRHMVLVTTLASVPNGVHL